MSESPIVLAGWSELPSIELYKDQVVALVEEQIQPFFISEDDKLITASMVNNYVKAELLPPPVKKRYNRVHLTRLIMTSILKQVLSIAEVGTLLSMAESVIKDDPERLYTVFCHLLARAQDPQAFAETGGQQDVTAAEAAVLLALVSCVCRARSRRVIAESREP